MKTDMTLLLWRCPLCGANDALRYVRRPLHRERVTCSACGAAWEVTRPPEQDFQLRVVAGPDASLGLALPLAEWYDRMKAGLHFQPLPAGSLQLVAGESLLLKGSGCRLFAREGNPILAGHPGPDAPLGPFEHETEPNWSAIGPGTLYFTDRRLIWQADGRSYDFWWDQVLSAFAFFLEVFGIMYGTTIYRFQLPGDSSLKWVTYAGLQAEKLKAAGGRAIITSVY
jgi:hypothetical protein